MKRKYFITVAITGLLAAIALAFYSMGHSFLEMLSIKNSEYEKYNGIVPIIAGASATLATGIYFDKKILTSHWIIKALAIPVVIFLAGAVVGTFVNYVLNGLQNYDSAAYLIKPLYVLALFGIPSAMIIGIVCFIISHFLKARSASLF